MGQINSFRELRVYQTAREAANLIYVRSKSFPAEERYSLTDQIRRSSRSVCANLAEAWRKRRYPASFVSKLSDADAEAAETSVWLDFAHDCGFLDDDIQIDLTMRYDQICAQLYHMMDHPEQWCPRKEP